MLNLLKVWWYSQRLRRSKLSPKASDYAVCQLQRLGAIKTLIRALKNLNSSVRRSAAHALGKLGDVHAVNSLISTLHDSDVSVRAGAAEALGLLGDTRALEPLITALQNSEGPWLSMVAEALGRLGDRRAVEPLIVALNNAESHEKLRMAAAKVFGNWGERRAVEPLIAVLQEVQSSTELSITVIEALGHIGDLRAVKPLNVVVKRGDIRASAAALALISFNSSETGHLFSHIMNNINAGNYNIFWSERAVDFLILKFISTGGTKDLVYGLVQCRDSRAIEPLVIALGWKDNAWKRLVADALIGIILNDKKARISETELEKVAKVEDIKTEVWSATYRRVTDECGHTESVPDGGRSFELRKVIDFADLRQVARQELIRRREARR